MNVCFISHSSHCGGAETSLLETIEALRFHGIGCYVLVPGRGPLNQELKARGVPNVGLPYSGWVFRGHESILQRIIMVAKTMVALVYGLIRVRRWRCDIVYTNTITMYLGALIARILRLPHVWHFREFGYEDHGLVFSFGDKFTWRIINSLGSVYIANSKAVAAMHQTRLRKPVHVIYNSMHRFKPADPVPEITKNEVPFRCIIVGSLNERKGQHEAIKALGILSQSDLKMELRILGKGGEAYKESLLQLSREYHLEQSIVFEGHVTDTASAIQRADAMLVCSRCEAFGRVTAEAMLSGKPVIGADTGGTVELIRDGFSGLLYRHGNPFDLADKIELLVRNRGRAQSMGDNGRIWAQQQFSKERYARELMNALAPLFHYDHRINTALR